MKLSVAGARVALLSSFAAAPVGAATLPAHGPLRVLVVSDEVNPHNLAAADLTQRGDISAALNAADAGLNLDGAASEVYSQCVDVALSALSSAMPPHVVVYFAHQAARGCDNSEKQPALMAAFEAHLQRGGGIVVFHHGGYAMGGKDAMLQLLGVSATGSVPWDTTVGQRVFNVAPSHFVTTNHVDYAGKAALAGSGDVPSGTFDYFDNIPDERYPGTMLLEQSGETRTILFASDSGGARVLGYSLERTGWKGRVLFYQPAEYQPHALDDRGGPNFQILANSIVYSVNQEGDAGGAGAGAGASAGGSGLGAGSGETGGKGAGSAAAGRENSAGSASNTAGAASGGVSGNATNVTVAGSTSSAGGRPNDGAGPASADSGSRNAPSEQAGCGCRLQSAQGGPIRPWRDSRETSAALTLLALVLRRRHRVEHRP